MKEVFKTISEGGIVKYWTTKEGYLQALKNGDKEFVVENFNYKGR